MAVSPEVLRPAARHYDGASRSHVARAIAPRRPTAFGAAVQVHATWYWNDWPRRVGFRQAEEIAWT